MAEPEPQSLTHWPDERLGSQGQARAKDGLAGDPDAQMGGSEDGSASRVPRWSTSGAITNDSGHGIGRARLAVVARCGRSDNGSHQRRVQQRRRDAGPGRPFRHEGHHANGGCRVNWTRSGWQEKTFKAVLEIGMPADTSRIGKFVAFAACEERVVITSPDP